MIAWDPAEFVTTPVALATDIDDIAVTMIQKDDGFILAFSLKLGGEAATLPLVESIATDVCRLIARHLQSLGGSFSPDG